MMLSQTLQPLRLEVSPLASSPLPLDLALVREHLAVDGTDNDALIETLVMAAVEWAEGQMRRTIFARSHTWVLREFPYGCYGELRLPRGKTQSVESITYVAARQTATLHGPSGSPAGSDWQEDLRGIAGAALMPPQGGVWPAVDYDAVSPVVINFTAGWASDEVPQDIIHALLFSVSDAFELRGTADFTVFGQNFALRESLLSPYRLQRFY